MKITAAFIQFLIWLIASVFFFSCSNEKRIPLRIAVASNAQFAADSLKKIFEAQHSANVELIISSSGKLTAQIKHGAPYDIFLSADMKYPKSVASDGMALTEPKVYALGKLVLWTTQHIDLENGLASLKNPSIKNIAVANPRTAPYGVATISALNESGIYDAVENKIVYGENISQVNQYQLTGAANVAFTALSVVKSPDIKNDGKFIIIADSLYRPIQQGVIILKHSNEHNLESAEAFYQLLFSEKGKAVFRYFGYSVN